MITASLIYAIVTVLLAFVDSIRIKKAKGVVENINHKVSDWLAAISMIAIAILCHLRWVSFLETAGYALFITVGCMFIRLAIYDLAINLWRREPIDYKSATTSSYEDQHTNHLSFWQKRAIGVAGWALLFIAHWIIFKTS